MVQNRLSRRRRLLAAEEPKPVVAKKMPAGPLGQDTRRSIEEREGQAAKLETRDSEGDASSVKSVCSQVTTADFR